MGLHRGRLTGFAAAAGLAAIAVGLAACGGEERAPIDPGARSVVLVDRPFVCGRFDQPLDLELVKVTMTAASTTRTRDAVRLSLGECTGRIGRIEVDTWRADGVKVHHGARDLVVEGGYIRCHDREGGVHQDGIHAMGGERVTFRNIRIDCRTPQGSAFFVNQGAGRRSTPTEIVCVGCLLAKGPRRNRVVRINHSIRSGIRDSIVVWCGKSCPGHAVVVGSAASQPVNHRTALVTHESRGPD
jgi:hypothetical protein